MKKLARQDYTKIIIAVSSLIIAFSVAYYFVLRPIQKDKPLNDCLAEADAIYKTFSGNIYKAFDEDRISSEEKASKEIEELRNRDVRRDACYKKF